MGSELAVYSPQDLVLMAAQVENSGLFGMTKSQAFTLMLLCQAKGLHPIEAVLRYHIIKTRPTMKADAMLAEFQAKGGVVKWDHSAPDRNKLCRATFYHPVHATDGNPVEFSYDDAVRAGLPDINPNWKKYPSNMLRARVISNGIRMTMPGVVAGIYTPEEVQDFDPPPLRAEARVAEPAAIEEAPPTPRPEEAGGHVPTLSQYLDAQLKGWGDALDRALNDSGLSIAAPDEPNRHSTVRHLVKWAVAGGLFPDPGKLSQADANRLMGDHWRLNPHRHAETCGEVQRYLAGWTRRLLDEAASDGPVIDAEPGDEAAEVEVGAAEANGNGREPGEEG